MTLRLRIACQVDQSDFFRLPRRRGGEAKRMRRPLLIQQFDVVDVELEAADDYAVRNRLGGDAKVNLHGLGMRTRGAGQKAGDHRHRRQ